MITSGPCARRRRASVTVGGRVAKATPLAASRIARRGRRRGGPGAAELAAVLGIREAQPRETACPSTWASSQAAAKNASAGAERAP